MSDNRPARIFYSATEAYREVLRWEEIARTNNPEKAKILRDAAIHASLEEAMRDYEKYPIVDSVSVTPTSMYEEEIEPDQEGYVSKYNVREADLFEAVEFMQGKQIAKKNNVSFQNESIEFTDGTKVECESRWRGPYSEATPDIEAYPPVFYIYEPKEQKA